MRTPLIVTAIFSICLAQTLPAFAQDANAPGLSAEEITTRFQKHRGLTLAPPPGEAPVPTAGTVVQPVPIPELVEIPQADQVNINIVFDFDSAVLREDQKPRLAALCQAMQGSDIALFRIVGHTDASGPAKYNDQLSTLRAEEVKRYLVRDCGLAASRLEAVGAGKRQLLDTANPTSERNRRVEFQAIS